MNKTVIIINGKGGVGKDTLCDMAAKHFKVTNVSSITPIKAIARICGWKGEKDDKSRKFLSDLKSLLIEYGDLPNKYLIGEYEAFKSLDNEILFVHIREASEIQKFKDSIGSDCITLLVERNTVVKNWGNSSDDNVEQYKYDYIFPNNNLLETTEFIFIRFLKEIIQLNANKILSVKTPAGLLTATRTNDSEFPGILIKLLSDNGNETMLSLLEHDGKTLRNVLWDTANDDDEPSAIINFNPGE